MPFNDTANRGYPLPDPINRLDEDVLRLIASLTAIDADVASLFTSMTGKASATHGHVIADVAGLQAALDAKLGAGTAFALDDLSDVSATGVQANMFLRWSGTAWVPVVLDGAMVATGTIPGARLGTHGHAIGDVTGLQTALDGKAASSHTHAIGDVTGLQTALDGKAASSHTHTMAQVTGLDTALAAKADATAIVGKQTLNLPAGSLIARTTNSAASLTEELATNDVMVFSWAFDASVSEAVQSPPIRMPKGWNEGTVEVEFQWKHPSTTTNFGVRWAARARAYSDNEDLDAAWGTAQGVSDTGGTTGRVYISAFTAALTIGGTPAENDLVIFEFYRDPANAADTMAVDAHLLGVTILYTTNAAKDD